MGSSERLRGAQQASLSFVALPFSKWKRTWRLDSVRFMERRQGLMDSSGRAGPSRHKVLNSRRLLFRADQEV